MEEFTLKHPGLNLGLRGPEEVLRCHGNETFYADDTRGNYAHPKLGDYVQERCQGWGHGLNTVYPTKMEAFEVENDDQH